MKTFDLMQLCKYDPIKNCFVLAGTRKQYWPGTNIVKSTRNAFNWQRQSQQPKPIKHEARIP